MTFRCLIVVSIKKYFMEKSCNQWIINYSSGKNNSTYIYYLIIIITIIIITNLITFSGLEQPVDMISFKDSMKFFHRSDIAAQKILVNQMHSLNSWVFTEKERSMCLIVLRNKTPAIYITHGIQTDHISPHSPPFHPREKDHLSHDSLVLFCVDRRWGTSEKGRVHKLPRTPAASSHLGTDEKH